MSTNQRDYMCKVMSQQTSIGEIVGSAETIERVEMIEKHVKAFYQNQQ